MLTNDSGGIGSLIDVDVSIERWWKQLPASTRAWIARHNADEIPTHIIDQITAAGGPERSNPWWQPSGSRAGLVMPDSAVDWIEIVANTSSAPEDNPEDY